LYQKTPIVSKNGHISAFGPSNLLLIVDSAVNIEKIISILKLIDQPTVSEEESRIFVYFLEYADAAELSKVLQGIIRNLQTARKAVSRNGKKRAARTPPVLNVTPDQATNSLIIVAPQSEYGNIEEVIKILDKKRKQVYVEAMIMEASTDRLQELGTKWRAAVKHNGEPIVIGGVGKIDTATTLSIINGLSGFSMGGLGNFFDVPVTAVGSDGSVSTTTLTAPGFAALFSSEEFKDVINVLSTPQILTSDNEEAEIFVGENSPFISQGEKSAATTASVINTIQRTDVGIILRINPQITEGNYVKLEVFQEISAVKSASDDILTTVGPTTTKRTTKTSVVVKDGRTVVIGGLMQEREEISINKVPILGDIPILGWLFKYRFKKKDKRNLLVFLSPHIIKEEYDLTTITESKRERFVKEGKFYIQGELFVKFNDGVSEERALELIKKGKASVIKHFKSSGVYHIKLKYTMEVEEAIEKFTAYPEVMYTEPNYKVSLKSNVLNNGNQGGVDKPSCPEEKVDDKGNQESMMKEQEGDKKKLLPVDTKAVEVKTVIQDKPDTEVQYSDTEIPEKISSQQVEQAVDHEKSSDPEKIKTAIKKTAEVKSIDAETSEDEIKKTNNKIIQAETAEKPHNGNFYIQIGAWKNNKHAIEKYTKLKSRYPETYIIKENDYSKVRIAGIMTKREGNLMIMELEDDYNLLPFLANNH